MTVFVSCYFFFAAFLLYLRDICTASLDAALMAKGSVLWRRNELEDDEIWDDSEMIAAYNRAAAKIKEEISKRSQATSEKHTSRQEPSTGWKQGDYCIAVYSGDNLPYEAKIKFIKGKYCTVHYIGYGNEERVLLADIHPSEGKQARQAQQARARSSIHTSTGAFHPMPQFGPAPEPQLRHKRRSAFSSSTSRIPSIPPPPPPSAFSGDLKDNGALSSMLMSWYMSGYHTGFYQALQQSREEQNCCHSH